MIKSLFFQTIAVSLMFVLAIWSVNAYLYTTFGLYLIIIFVHLYYAGNPNEMVKSVKKDSVMFVIYPFVHILIMHYFDVTFNAMLANIILGLTYYALIIYNYSVLKKLRKGN